MSHRTAAGRVGGVVAVRACSRESRRVGIGLSVPAHSAGEWGESAPFSLDFAADSGDALCMAYVIRPEESRDYDAVEAMTRDAFWRFWEPGLTVCQEHLLVHRMRSEPEFLPELSLVADDGGQIVGHIAFMRAAVVPPDGARVEVLTFGPLSVAPDQQGRGIGQALMVAGFDVARSLGFRGVVIFGHPSYYPRAGFVPAASFGITAGGGASFDAIMALELIPGGLDGVAGEVHLPAVYESLTDDDSRAFDAGFPGREPHTPIPLDTFAARLSPSGAAALADSGIASIEMLTTRSEREIRGLDGVGDADVEILLEAASEHGVHWGGMCKPGRLGVQDRHR